MLMFCPTCANILVVEEGPKCYRFACNTCPYIFNIDRKISNRKYPKLKEVDDVLGGAAAWENVDSTEAVRNCLATKLGMVNGPVFELLKYVEETCPSCGHGRAFFMQIQTRSADEPMTTFYKCCDMSCCHRWRD